MTTVELLQQIGLTKYEAEAYCSLLTYGALTGYEVGKRSQVPLSRSYEVLERLLEKGLVFVQPGDPPRYAAQQPQQVLGQVRSSMETTLGALTTALDALVRTKVEGEFWVVRGRQHVLDSMRTLIAATRTSLSLTLPADYSEAISDVLAQIRGGCTVFYAPLEGSMQGTHNILLLRDAEQGFVGTITPLPSCQAVSSTNPGLLLALQGYFEYQRLAPVAPSHALRLSASAQQSDWLSWETRKQRHLLQTTRANHVA